MARKVGRPNKLNSETKKKLLGSIALGLSYADSCTMAGIHYKTFNNWKNIGIEGKRKEYIDFLDAIKRAEITGKAQNIKKIKDDDSWQSKAWLLERQHPQEFGTKGQDINVNVDVIIPDSIK